MLVLSSVAVVALLLSAVALSQILPGYFIQQAESRLLSASTATRILIQEQVDQYVERSGSESLPAPEVVNAEIFQSAVQYAANQIAEATVSLYDVAPDGQRTLAARAAPSDPDALRAQQLAPDPEVAQAAARFPVTAGIEQRPMEVVISDPYTSRAATLNQVRGTLLAAGVIALAGALLLGVIAARQLTGPINRLRRVSARLARGDLDERASPSGVAEIDQLATQFNLMADRLSESLRLLEADRDRLREFVADVSHELRTPIAALRTFNDLQRSGGIDEATREEFLDRSTEQLRRLEWLSNNLLDLSRIDAGIFPLDIREGDLREPLRSVVEAHAEVAEERGIGLVSAVPAQAVTLRFDRERIVQLATNLIGNALKFTAPGGEVHATLRDEPGEAVLEVRDTGPGIPEGELPHIFDRFYRGTNVGEARASGSGLGLAIVRSIVEMHGGSIEVASVVGEGTAFAIHLPRPPVVPQPAEAAAPASRGPRLAGRRRKPATGAIAEPRVPEA